MKYTAGELRKMNGRKCKFQYEYKPEAEWEIYVVDWEVVFVSNEKEYSNWWLRKEWYEYSWLLFYKSRKDNYTYDYQITFLNEQKTLPEKYQNIYYDDNGEEIREWDLVMVGDDLTDKRIFLCKVNKSNFPYIVVYHRDEKKYLEWEIVWWDIYQKCIKYKDEKKLRELMLTDEEYEEVKKLLNIQ